MALNDAITALEARREAWLAENPGQTSVPLEIQKAAVASEGFKETKDGNWRFGEDKAD